MSSDENFTSPAKLQEWIETKGVSPTKASEAAATLFNKGFDSPYTLIGVSAEGLRQVGIDVPVAQYLSNKLNTRQEDGNLESLQTPTTKRMKSTAKPKTAEDLVQHCRRATSGKETGYSFELGDLINDQVIERNDTLAEVKGLICKLLEASASPQTQDDKAKFPIGCAVCGSGGGKSTLCALVEQKWTDYIRDAINERARELEMNGVATVTTAFATFNSTCNYDNDEASRLSPQASLGIRLVASRNGWSHHAVSNFLRGEEEPLAFAHLRLRAFLEKLVPETDAEAVIILVDEILKIEDANEIHTILLIMSDFQQECLRNSRKLFVLVTSLTSRPTADLTRKTQRRVLPISLPPISPLEVVKQAKVFAGKLIKDRDDIHENLRHHLITEFCSSGGLVKNMNAVVEYFRDKSNLPSNAALRRVPGEYSWIPKVLRHSIFGEPLSCSASTGTKSVEDLIFDHRVAVVKTILDSDNCQRVLVRIPAHLLRSVGVFEENDCSLSTNQTTHLQKLMEALGENRQTDGSCAKPFEIAMMRVLCLRLSLTLNQTTLDRILPGCLYVDKTLLEKAIDPGDCDWIEVRKLTREEVKKQRKHGTMVYSRLYNEGAVEGFWYLIIDNKPFVLFLQMKFWKYCPPGEVEKWETSIHKRAESEYNLSRGQDYAPLFFSTSATFRVSSSLAMPKEATEHLLEPFGICPMMLYAEERYKKS